MAKYQKFQRSTPKKQGLHPIWRGIGCILLVIVPLLSYWLTTIFKPMILATGKVPYQLLGHVVLPDWAYKYRILYGISVYISSINDLGLNVIMFLVIALILTTISSLLYAAMYSVVGPTRYTELDAPPANYKPKVYKR